MRLNGLFSTESYCKPQNNGFHEASKVGDEGVRELLPLLDQHSFNGRFLVTDKGPLSEFLQKSVGDVIINCKNKKVWTFEIKTERKTTGNLFLEMWSNRSRLTHGWLHTLKADFLWYYFQDSKILYSIPLPKLQEWAFVNRRIYQYPERKQNAYQQLNDTWGSCVPIQVIEKEVGIKKFHKGVDF